MVIEATDWPEIPEEGISSAHRPCIFRDKFSRKILLWQGTTDAALSLPLRVLSPPLRGRKRFQHLSLFAKC